MMHKNKDGKWETLDPDYTFAFTVEDEFMKKPSKTPDQRKIVTNWSTSLVLDDMAQKYNKTPIQIAINWLICQKNVVTLSKSTNLGHLKENLGALGWSLEDGDIEKLRKEFPDQEEVSDAVALG